MAFCRPMAPLSRSLARIASVRIPSGSLGDTGAAPCGRAQPSRPGMHSYHGVVLITDCSGAGSLAWRGRPAVRSGLMPASRAFCALRWPMSNSHPGLGLRGRRTELAALDRLLAEARAGHIRLLVVGGEGRPHASLAGF